MKASLVISIKNRTKLFRRSLKLYSKQTMSKQDWELVVVDDDSTEDVLSTLKEYAPNLNWQYIRMDSNKNDFPIFWGPSLSNNIGIKAAKGEVVVITGPEMLMKEDAIDISYKDAVNSGNSIYGHIYHSNFRFVHSMDKNIDLENLNFEDIIKIPGAKYQDITKNTFYWFWLAVKRDVLMSINGCDEEYLRGICGDDNDIANRLHAVGAKNTHNYKIIGIHQDHKFEDRADPKRIRRSHIWEAARLRNTQYLQDWDKRNKEVLVNKNRDWGSDKLIISKEYNFI